MANILIICSTVDGQTLKICSRLADTLQAASHTASIRLIEQTTLADIQAAEKIVLGASIRYGKHRRNVYDFIKQHQAEIERKANAFFSVNVVARKPAKNTPQTNPYVQKFLTLSPWQPQQLAVFAGKINYRQYRIHDRTMIRFIMWLTKGPTEKNANVEFTNWEKVAAFAQVIAEM